MNILHISDIHFGYLRDKAGAKLSPIESAHVFHDKRGHPRPDILSELILANESLQVPPDLVVASGDIGWSSDKEDYDFALSFFRAIRERWPSTELCIIPGNHDVRLLDAAISDAKRQDTFFQFLLDLYDVAALRERFPFLTDHECATRELVDRENLFYANLLSNNLLVLGFNSAASMTEFSSPIFISNDHLARVEKYINKLVPAYSIDRVARIATLHHHVLPFVESNLWAKGAYDPSAATKLDPTILSNSASFQEWLKTNRIDLVLHGHKHRFHGREDTLWTGNPSNSVRKVAIVGAGSAGVNLKHVARSDVNSFNVLDLFEASATRISLRVSTVRYEYDGARPQARETVERFVTAGEPTGSSTAVFEARDLVACHKKISAICPNETPIRNFISVVDKISDDQFSQITTARLGPSMAKMIDFDLCFSALHPEWHATSGWDDLPDGIEADDRCVAIQHGTRLFREIADRNGKSHRPIEYALRERPTRRYVGLYDAEIEIQSRGANLPGLVGVQFVEAEDRTLDIILTFRNIELSFWWVVNHLEALRLLRWACRKTGDFSPGKVVIFSPFAEWLKDDPKPVMRIALETMSLTELLALVLGSFRSADKKASERLKGLVTEFQSRLNKNNIHLSGLDKLCTAMEAADRAVKEHGLLKQWKLDPDIIKQITIARDALDNALENFEDRTDFVLRAQSSLDAALAKWN